MPEFDLIRRLQDIVGETADVDRSGCLLGIGDDAALFRAEPGEQLAVCTDTLVEGVHFPAGTHPGAIGYKALAVNLSDLAAMGADPAWFLLSLALPSADEDWLDDFSQGLAALARDAEILLAGGDTTSGPLTVTITAAGRVPLGQALTRHGAQEGDDVYVSGLPGRAARALRDLQSGVTPTADGLRALEFPEPRLALGRSLRGVASACIDVSDGLAADLAHVLERSSAGAVLAADRLPAGPGLDDLPEEERWQLQLSGGDDYELCFTAAPGKRGLIAGIARESGLPLTRIGTITAAPGLVIERGDGSPLQLGHAGYQHFGADSGAGA